MDSRITIRITFSVISFQVTFVEWLKVSVYLVRYTNGQFHPIIATGSWFQGNQPNQDSGVEAPANRHYGTPPPDPWLGPHRNP